MLNGQQQVPIQEAIHMLDNQELVTCSDRITYVSLAPIQALQSDEADKSKQKALITVYRNQKEEHYPQSLELYFYCVFVDSTFKKQGDKNYSTDQHRILMPKGMNCKTCYPVDYDYARGMLIMHKPWNKTDTLDKLLKDKQRTFDKFLRMLGEKKVTTPVQAQYLTAMIYSVKPRVEVLVKDGVNRPDTDDIQIDNETNERMDARIHGSHLTDNKLLYDSLNNTTVDPIKTGQ
jgi:hypothetical protein